MAHIQRRTHRVNYVVDGRDRYQEFESKPDAEAWLETHPELTGKVRSTAKPYQARYRDEGGREHTKRFLRKADADRWLSINQADVVRGEWLDPSSRRVTVRAFAAQWLELQVWRESTRALVDHSLAYILGALGDRQLVSLEKDDVQKFVSSIKLSPASVRNIHQHLRTLLGAAVEARLIVRNPAVKVKLPEVVKAPVVPLTAEQVWMAVDAATPILRAAVLVGAGLGLRQGEVTGLTADRIDWLAGRSVRVDRQLVSPSSGVTYLGPPKTKAAFRTVPAPNVVLEALAAHIQAHGTGSITDPDGRVTEGLVFHLGGRPMRRSSFGNHWRATVKAAGLPHGTRFHDLRHHFASGLIASGCSVKAVQVALGHATAKETLDTYGHLWPTDHERIRLAVDATLARPAANAERSADKLRTRSIGPA